MNNPIWLTVPQLAELLHVTYEATIKAIERGKYKTVQSVSGRGRGGKVFQINLYDPAIPLVVRARYFDTINNSPKTHGEVLSGSSENMPVTVVQGGEGSNTPVASSFAQLSDAEIDLELYSNSPAWVKTRVDKYLDPIKASAGIRGQDLREFIAYWNDVHPDEAISYPRLIAARRRYQQEGISGLFPHYGKTIGATKVSDFHFEYFKSVYMKEGAPGLKSCWLQTLGRARQLEPGLSISDFPAPYTFFRRLSNELPKDAIYLARYGHDAHNRKYANYIDRDYTNLIAGECIISDHAQIDVAVKLPSGRVCFPWITAWKDFKTNKWLGWMHHAEAPNSDHIFQSFYYSVKEYGLPTDVYIDNGKDYRAKDFAGGRHKFYKVAVDVSKTTSTLAMLSITPHFALPYNAQTKTIERDFLKVKEWFSKHMKGYRGGDVVERPQVLADEIKRGDILSYEEYKTLLDRCIVEVLNQMPSNGKVLKGMSPDQAWAAEQREVRKVSSDALKLFCMRTTRDVTIMRNGVRDSELGLNYWAEWMSGSKGVKVYVRRDVNAYQDAWVFRAGNDEYLGKAQIAETAAAIARTDIEKAKLRMLLTAKNQERKIIKAYAAVGGRPSASDAIMDLAAGVETINQMRGYDASQPGESPVYRLSNTTMDIVIREEKAMQQRGTADIRQIRPPDPPKKRSLFQCETDRDYALQHAQNQNDLNKSK